jgi:integrase
MKLTFSGHDSRDLTTDNSSLSLTRIEPLGSTDGSALATFPDELSPDLQSLLRAATSDATRRAYRSDLDHFLGWGGSVPTSSQMLAEYLVYFAPSLVVATLGRRVVAIGKANSTQGFDNPASSDLVRHAMRGIRRTFGKPQRQAAAAVKEDVLAMCGKLGDRLKDIRDRAILLVGFAGAFRRSELVALECCDLDFVSLGVVITLRRSKTDQEGEGRKIAIPHGRGSVCPVAAIKEWLAVSLITEGPIFRSIDRHSRLSTSSLSGDAVALIVKHCASAAGLDGSKYSGHSLRAGLATSAAAAGVSGWKIKAQTGHKSDAMVGRYIRDGQLFKDNASGAVL